jgi:hypothetical protein
MGRTEADRSKPSERHKWWQKRLRRNFWPSSVLGEAAPLGFAPQRKFDAANFCWEIQS